MAIILRGVATTFVGPAVDYAGPVGVEGVLVYNGLRLNDRIPGEHRSGSYFRIDSIDGRDDADVRDVRTVNSDDHGEEPGPALYGGRTLVISGTIRAQSLSEMRLMENQLKLAFGDLREKPLVFESVDTALNTEIYCRKSSKLTILDQQNDFRFWRPFQVTLRASNPRFTDQLSRIAVLEPVAVEGGFRVYPRLNGTSYSLFFDEDGNEAIGPNEYSVVNNGTMEAEVIATFYGRLVDPRLNNLTTGESVILNGTIDSTESVSIDMRMNRHTIIDGNGDNRFDMLDDYSTWLRLVPGVNLITISVVDYGSTSHIDLSYKNSWL